jgi:hypothetical protein
MVHESRNGCNSAAPTASGACPIEAAERITFATRRELDFFSEGELTRQIGFKWFLWPVALLKELVDNGLDGCERCGPGRRLAPRETGWLLGRKSLELLPSPFLNRDRGLDHGAKDGGQAQSPGRVGGRLLPARLPGEPLFLKETTYDQVLRRWLEDHPGETTVPQRIKDILYNLKSTLLRQGRKKPGRPRAAMQTGGPGTSPKGRAPGAAVRRDLEHLEEQIDECLTLGKRLDREGLGGVLALLRQARNEVVWKLGQ